MEFFLRRGVIKGYGAFRAACNVTFALIFSAVAMAQSVAEAEPITVVALGDSLTAGYGLEPEQGLVPQLQGWLQARGADVVVQNAGVSGDTTAGGRARVDWALGPDADALMVTLGGNDMMRGLPVDQVRANLTAVLEVARARDLPVLLVAMKAPPNFGADYKAGFDAVYGALAPEYDALLMPDFFQGFIDAGGVMTRPSSYAGWMQADGIHPNAEGVGLVVAALGPHVLELVEKVEKVGE